jgi:hypothetical protein
MTNEEKLDFANSVFMDMLNLFRPVAKEECLNDSDKAIIVHHAITNFIGAFFAGMLENETHFNVVLSEISKDSKKCFLRWSKIKNEQMDKH